MSPASRGFHRRRQTSTEDARRVPPGQYVTRDFPVLSAGPTPHTPLDHCSFSIGRGDQQKTWSWAEFRARPSQDVTVDIHCVTKWTKLGPAWQGVATTLSCAGRRRGHPHADPAPAARLDRLRPPRRRGHAGRGGMAGRPDSAGLRLRPDQLRGSGLAALVRSGYPPERVKTERFRGTGGTGWTHSTATRSAACSVLMVFVRAHGRICVDLQGLDRLG